MDDGAVVTAYPDGPLVIRGDFVLRDASGAEIEQYGSAAALCRCGKSSVKPFCDGTHKKSRRVARRLAATEQRDAAHASGPGD